MGGQAVSENDNQTPKRNHWTWKMSLMSAEHVERVKNVFNTVLDFTKQMRCQLIYDVVTWADIFGFVECFWMFPTPLKKFDNKSVAVNYSLIMTLSTVTFDYVGCITMTSASVFSFLCWRSSHCSSSDTA